MGRALVNGELSVIYPKGFVEMSEAELLLAYQTPNPDRWGIWDKRHHIIVAVLYHVTKSRFLARMVSTRSLAERVERATRKAYRDKGYQSKGFFEMRLCGSEAHGFAYEYEQDGVAQVGEAIVFQHGTCCYTLYYYARQSNREASHRVFEDILDSLDIE